MDYNSICDYLDDAPSFSYGLDNINRLMSFLSLPLEKMRFVHITGTNGKGSVSAFIRSALAACGYKVGGYSSPAVFDRKECITFNGVSIDSDSYCRAFSKIYEAIKAITSQGYPKPTAFEIETALALAYFCDCGCDVAVIEVGLGGLDDATNVIKDTAVAVFSSIGVDHIGVLGGSLSAIAYHKAGIIKEGCSVVTAIQPPEVMRVISDTAKSKCKDMKVCDAGNIKLRGDNFQIIEVEGTDYKVALQGDFQAQNLAVALGALDALRARGFKIRKEEVMRGISAAVWNGRMQVIGRNPHFILDGAHNIAAASALADSLRVYYPNKKITLLMGIFKDKDYVGILEKLSPLANALVTFDWDNPRAMGGLELLNVASGIKVKFYEPDISDAVARALDLGGSDGVILAAGSLSHLKYIAQAYEALRGRK